MCSFLKVFNAESQVNYCGFLRSAIDSSTNSAIYGFSNMRSHFTAWSTNSEEDDSLWSRLKTPPEIRQLLCAAPLSSSEPAVCLLSSSALKRDLRLSLVKPDDAKMVSRLCLFKEGECANMDCDVFYAEVLNQPQTIDGEFDVLTLTRHSIHRLKAKMVV